MAVIIAPTTSATTASLDLTATFGPILVAANGVFTGDESIIIEIPTQTGYQPLVEDGRVQRLHSGSNALITEAKAIFRLNKSETVNQIGVTTS